MSALDAKCAHQGDYDAAQVLRSLYRCAALDIETAAAEIGELEEELAVPELNKEVLDALV